MGKLREGSHLRGWAGPLYTNTYVYYIYIYVCVAEYMMLLQSHIYIYTYTCVRMYVCYICFFGWFLSTYLHTIYRLAYLLPPFLPYILTNVTMDWRNLRVDHRYHCPVSGACILSELMYSSSWKRATTCQSPEKWKLKRLYKRSSAAMSGCFSVAFLLHLPQGEGPVARLRRIRSQALSWRNSWEPS